MSATPYTSLNAEPALQADPLGDPHAENRGYASSSDNVAGKIFLWFAWAAAAAFWVLMLTTGAGILAAGDSAAVGRPGGGADAGGSSWLLITVVGVAVLGAALAFASFRYATRNKANDPLTEAATRVEYDMVEAAGGDDDIHRSPEAHKPEERDAYRALNP